MRWYTRAACLMSTALGLGAIAASLQAEADAPRPPFDPGCSTSAGISPATAGPDGADPLDSALARAGMCRVDLGFSPQGWWLRYPRGTQYKLDHFDDLFRQPLVTVPFIRTMAQAVRESLSPEGLAASDDPADMLLANKGLTSVLDNSWGPWSGHSLYRLVNVVAVQRRYGGAHYLNTPYLTAQPTPLGEAIIALDHDAGEPTGTLITRVESPQPVMETQIRRRAALLSPEVGRILGRLVMDLVDAHRQAALAFRNVSAEQRIEIHRRVDMWNAMGTYGGLEYTQVHVFDDVMKAWDEASLWYAGLKCVEALDRARRALQALSPEKLDAPALDWQTPLGWIRIRGKGSDEIDAADSLLVVDLGGDDKWQGSVGASAPARLIGLALDLSGNDVYEGGAVTQGAGVAGIGILLDAAGDDRYEAQQAAQGFGQFGLGVLIDLGGDDYHNAGHSSQGSAAFGVGLLADAAGNDRYDILLNGQGFGGPGGVGILADRSGNDRYRAEPDAEKCGLPSYGTRQCASFAQGASLGRGFGPAQGRSWAGGVGMLTDIEGDDTYIAGDWSQGSTNWFGTGFLYDGSGNDHYKGGLWNQAAAAHYGIGVLIDDGGNDIHDAHTGLAYAHDMSIALFLANGGNDRYTASGSGLGRSANRSVALFIDAGGNDIYQGDDKHRPGFTEYAPEFLAARDGAGAVDVRAKPFILPHFSYVTSLGLFLDVGGKDTYRWGISDGDVWGDAPDSDNWKARNVGVGMDVPGGTIDWRPQRRR